MAKRNSDILDFRSLKNYVDGKADIDHNHDGEYAQSELATESTDGLMSKEDKKKLNNISANSSFKINITSSEWIQENSLFTKTLTHNSDNPILYVGGFESNTKKSIFISYTIIDKYNLKLSVQQPINAEITIIFEGTIIDSIKIINDGLEGETTTWSSQKIKSQLNESRKDIDDLKLSVSNGKQLIATAITDMGINASSDDTFQLLSEKISKIENNKVSIDVEVEFTPSVNTVNATINNYGGLLKSFKINDGEWTNNNKFTDLEPVQSYTFYGRIPDKMDLNTEIKTIKANQAIPSIPIIKECYSNSLRILVSEDCKIKFNDNLYDNDHLFTGLFPNTEYVFYSVKESTTKFNESISEPLVARTNITNTAESSVGPKVALQGNHINGYYGKVNNIITLEELKSMLGITTGTDTHSGDITWLKFTYQGRTLFIADRVLIININWETFNTTYDIAKAKLITIGDYHYHCRMISGSGGTVLKNVNNDSEWGNTIAKYTPDNNDSHWQEYYTWSICSDYDDTYDRQCLGVKELLPTSKIVEFILRNSNGYFSKAGWRPVLEVL